MTVHYGDGRQVIIKNRDLRVCGFYVAWLLETNRINTSNVPRQDEESCRKALNQLINQYYPDKEGQAKLLADMETACDENILPMESFYWLGRDERATFWLWGYLCIVTDYQLGISLSRDPRFGHNWYQFLQLSPSPTSHKERMKIIITFFDGIIIPTPPVNHLKSQVMERLKKQWENIYSKPLPLKWLPDEEDTVLWAWDSLKKFQQEKANDISGLYTSLFTPGLTTWFTPLSHAERCLALRAALDLWDYAPDTKRLFLLTLNKAWNQQKLRQSRTDKKALNTYLKNETKMRLDLLAAHHDVRISDMLEKMINAHYLKTFS